VYWRSSTTGQPEDITPSLAPRITSPNDQAPNQDVRRPRPSFPTRKASSPARLITHCAPALAIECLLSPAPVALWMIGDPYSASANRSTPQNARRADRAELAHNAGCRASRRSPLPGGPAEPVRLVVTAASSRRILLNEILGAERTAVVRSRFMPDDSGSGRWLTVDPVA
jgi:hypothetical protein